MQFLMAIFRISSIYLFREASPRPFHGCYAPRKPNFGIEFQLVVRSVPRRRFPAACFVLTGLGPEKRVLSNCYFSKFGAGRACRLPFDPRLDPTRIGYSPAAVNPKGIL